MSSACSRVKSVITLWSAGREEGREMLKNGKLCADVSCRGTGCLAAEGVLVEATDLK